MPIGAFQPQKIDGKFEDEPKLGHITTFGGNPVVATSALTTINEIVSTKLIHQIANKEKFLKKSQSSLIKKFKEKV